MPTWAPWFQQALSSGWCTGDPKHCQTPSGLGASGEPTPGLALSLLPRPHGKSHPASPSPLGFIHLCATPLCASRWVVAEDRPLEPKTQCPATGGQGQLGHFAQH